MLPYGAYINSERLLGTREVGVTSFSTKTLYILKFRAVCGNDLISAVLCMHVIGGNDDRRVVCMYVSHDKYYAPTVNLPFTGTALSLCYIPVIVVNRS